MKALKNIFSVFPPLVILFRFIENAKKKTVFLSFGIFSSENTQKLDSKLFAADFAYMHIYLCFKVPRLGKFV